MGKITCFYLLLTFLVYLSGVIFTIIRINDDLISKNLSLTYIIIDSIVLLYIIYRIFYIKKIHFITMFTKYLVMFWNIAYFGVIISIQVNYNEIRQLKFLSKNQLRTLFL